MNYKSNIDIRHQTCEKIISLKTLHFEDRDAESRTHTNENIEKNRTKYNRSTMTKEAIKEQVKLMKTCKNYQVKSTPFSTFEISLSVVRDGDKSKNWLEKVESEVGGFLHKDQKREKAVNDFVQDSYSWSENIDKWAKANFGDRYLGYELHMDEVNPHMHLIVRNYDPTTKLIDRRYFYTKAKLNDINKTLYLADRAWTKEKHAYSYQLLNERDELGNWTLSETERRAKVKKRVSANELKKGDTPPSRTAADDFKGNMINTSIAIENKTKKEINTLKLENKGLKATNLRLSGIEASKQELQKYNSSLYESNMILQKQKRELENKLQEIAEQNGITFEQLMGRGGQGGQGR